MEKKKWGFLSNHGRVFAYVTKYPDATTQKIANEACLSIRAVQVILDDLEEEGYLTRERVGRSNHYQTYLEKPMRHRLERQKNVGNLLLGLDIKYGTNKNLLTIK